MGELALGEDYYVGFVVVRLAGMQDDSNLAESPIKPIRRIGNVLYSGVDRCRWCDVEDDYFRKMLPVHLRVQLESIRKLNDDASGINVCRDYRTALELLNYSNRSIERDELIVVSSNLLQGLKGTANEKVSVKWLGWDVFAMGEWSLLSEGVFLKPQLFPGWELKINEYGLLPDETGSMQLGSEYHVLSHRGLLEELGSNCKIEAVRVGRVLP